MDEDIVNLNSKDDYNSSSNQITPERNRLLLTKSDKKTDINYEQPLDDNSKELEEIDLSLCSLILNPFYLRDIPVHVCSKSTNHYFSYTFKEFLLENSLKLQCRSDDEIDMSYDKSLVVFPKSKCDKTPITLLTNEKSPITVMPVTIRVGTVESYQENGRVNPSICSFLRQNKLVLLKSENNRALTHPLKLPEVLTHCVMSAPTKPEKYRTNEYYFEKYKRHISELDGWYSTKVEKHKQLPFIRDLHIRSHSKGFLDNYLTAKYCRGANEYLHTIDQNVFLKPNISYIIKSSKHDFCSIVRLHLEKEMSIVSETLKTLQDHLIELSYKFLLNDILLTMSDMYKYCSFRYPELMVNSNMNVFKIIFEILYNYGWMCLHCFYVPMPINLDAQMCHESYKCIAESKVPLLLFDPVSSNTSQDIYPISTLRPLWINNVVPYQELAYAEFQLLLYSWISANQVIIINPNSERFSNDFKPCLMKTGSNIIKKYLKLHPNASTTDSSFANSMYDEYMYDEKYIVSSPPVTQPEYDAQYDIDMDSLNANPNQILLSLLENIDDSSLSNSCKDCHLENIIDAFLELQYESMSRQLILHTNIHGFCSKFIRQSVEDHLAQHDFIHGTRINITTSSFEKFSFIRNPDVLSRESTRSELIDDSILKCFTESICDLFNKDLLSKINSIASVSNENNLYSTSPKWIQLTDTFLARLMKELVESEYKVNMSIKFLSSLLSYPFLTCIFCKDESDVNGHLLKIPIICPCSPGMTQWCIANKLWGINNNTDNKFNDLPKDWWFRISSISEHCTSKHPFFRSIKDFEKHCKANKEDLFHNIILTFLDSVSEYNNRDEADSMIEQNHIANVVSKDTSCSSNVQKLENTAKDSDSELEWEEGNSITYNHSKEMNVMNNTLEERQSLNEIILQEDQSSVLPNTNCVVSTQKTSNCSN